MWEKVAGFILRKRVILLSVTIAITAVMGYFATKIQLTYDLPRIVPADDPDYLSYVEFKKTFGDDGNVILLGLKSDKVFSRDFMNAYFRFSQRLTKLDGVQNVISYPTLQVLTKVDSLREFKLLPLMTDTVATQQQTDSLWDIIRQQKFYSGLAVGPSGNFVITGVTLNKERLNSKSRIGVIDAFEKEAFAFEKQHGVEFKISGLPYIRTIFSAKINKELKLFTLLSLVVCAAIMLLFFRSFSSLLYSLIIVVIALIWGLGYIGILGYKITAVIGVIPPMLVIIGITNCIYLLNKYHSEYRAHKNKSKALIRVVSRIGKAAFLTNFTTAIGFGVFYFSGSPIMLEFGLVAFLSIMSVFLISMVTVPVMFSFLPPPTYRQTKHLENQYLSGFINAVVWNVQNRRRLIYAVTVIVLAISIVGMLRLRPLGYVIDDLPAKDKISRDLKFFEKEINGVMPF
ncbi:MAG TPA: MMPL family transporter, partial [Bacteroidia bacterium]|nr:MMPL family transporter [Bacteroidia bacterium]